MQLSNLFLCLVTCFGSFTVLAQADPTPVPVEDTVLVTPDSDVLEVVINMKGSSGFPAKGVQVALYDVPSGRIAARGRTDAMGSISLAAPFTGRYRLETCDPRYFSTGAVINDCGSDGEPTLMCVEGFDFFTYDDAAEGTGADHILLAELELDSLAVGQIVDLDNILYDYDKATLRPESRRELDQLVRALKQLPGLDIELRSHTDSRGTEAYNQDLSQRRAQSVVDYLVDHGVTSNRFTAKGFGESRLLNECADGVECSEAKHQRNRRTEFEIKAYEARACPELADR